MNEELSLDQLLADPLIRMVMSSDSVEEADIRRLAGRLSLHKADGQTPVEAAEPPPRRARPAYRMPPHLVPTGCAAQSCFA